MSEFEALLDVCLEALREGRWDIDECLRRYPKHADELRPHLLAAAAVASALHVEPREEFARSARERFAVASGERLRQAYDVEPEPSFFAAARMRFLMAAHRMRAGDRRARPFIERHFRALAGAAAAVVLFLSFSTYTVASASNALPGDWQYPIKLQTERVRLAFAFSDDAKRSVRLDRAEERAREIERLAKKGRKIDSDVLGRLVEQTKPLVDDADHNWDTEDLARLQSVAARESEALHQAQPSVDAAARDKLVEALDVSKQAIVVSNDLIVTRPDRLPSVITPSVPLNPSDEATPTPSPSATPDASATPPDSATPGTPSPETPRAGSPTSTPSGGVQVGETPESVRGEVSWIRLSVGRFTTLIPSEDDGWRITEVDMAPGSVPGPTLVKLANTNATSLITFNVRTGDMYWFINRNGTFDEIQMRLLQPDGQVVVVDKDYVHAVYGDDATIPLFILDNIEMAPEPAPTPQATDTSSSPTP